MNKYFLISLSCASLLSNIFASQGDQEILNGIEQRLNAIQQAYVSKGEPPAYLPDIEQVRALYNFLEDWVTGSSGSIADGLGMWAMTFDGYSDRLNSLYERLGIQDDAGPSSTPLNINDITSNPTAVINNFQYRNNLTETVNTHSTVHPTETINTHSTVHPTETVNTHSTVHPTERQRSTNENAGNAPVIEAVLDDAEYNKLFCYANDSFFGNTQPNSAEMITFLNNLRGSAMSAMYETYRHKTLSKKIDLLLKVRDDPRFSLTMRKTAADSYVYLFGSRSLEEATSYLDANRQYAVPLYYFGIREMIVETWEKEHGQTIAPSQESVAYQNALNNCDSAEKAAKDAHNYSKIMEGVVSASLTYRMNLRTLEGTQSELDRKTLERDTAQQALKDAKDTAAMRLNVSNLETALDAAKTARDTKQQAYDAAKDQWIESQNALVEKVEQLRTSQTNLNLAKMGSDNAAASLARELMEARSSYNSAKEAAEVPEVDQAVKDELNQKAIALAEAEAKYKTKLQSEYDDRGLTRLENVTQQCVVAVNMASRSVLQNKDLVDQARAALDEAIQQLQTVENNLNIAKNGIDTDDDVIAKSTALSTLENDIMRLQNQVQQTVTALKPLKDDFLKKTDAGESLFTAISNDERVVEARRALNQLLVRQ